MIRSFRDSQVQWLRIPFDFDRVGSFKKVKKVLLDLTLAQSRLLKSREIRITVVHQGSTLDAAWFAVILFSRGQLKRYKHKRFLIPG